MSALCPHGCGYFGAMRDVKKHIHRCPESVIKPLCRLRYCPWKGDITTMKEHFLRYHQLTEFFRIKQDQDKTFTINFKQYELYLYAFSTIYFLLESKDGSDNFWLRLYKKNKKCSIILFHIMHIRDVTMTVLKMFHFNVKVPSNPDQVFAKLKVRNWMQNIMCKTFNGNDIFKIEIEKELVNKSKENYICTTCNIACRMPVYFCANKHIACLNCFDMDLSCKTLLESQKECGLYVSKLCDLETLCAELFELSSDDYSTISENLNCSNEGCSFIDNIEPLSIHKKKCIFATTECVVSDCTFKSTYVNLENHWNKNHKDLLFQNNSKIDNTFKQIIGITANKYFYLKFIKQKGKNFLYVFHLTEQDNTRFRYDLVCSKHSNDKCSVLSGKIEVSNSSTVKLKVDYDCTISNQIKIQKSCRLTLSIFYSLGN